MTGMKDDPFEHVLDLDDQFKRVLDDLVKLIDLIIVGQLI